ncbi:dolichol kinase [Thermosphaera chiliense]|uniref:Dolichol kinase n=1 Tax=Thermosphaera chiliense TaxID=3402707 RepID=A0A7M1URF7_9CREN|nr:dolichol kinase [Thermosphaera aggregans]QOR94549.1 dolichol kinase [Thermosphaera aggregans]
MLDGLSTEVLIRESIYTAILFIWVLIVVIPLTKFTYNMMIKKRTTHIKAVYYNRKIIHILAGGVVSILIPLLGYTTPLTIIPMLVLLFLATYIPHKTGKLLYWFQDPDNINEVNFVIMWGAVMITSWVVFRDWVYGVVPVAFMSFGDGITGIVRNALYNRRNKSWFGNLAMAVVTVPVGQIILGLPGAFAGLVASIIEHFEIHSKIDDNITVPLVSFLIILGFRLIGG